MEAWSFDSRDPDETRAAGRELGRSIGADGLAIALVGPLGAGKTVFVKGLAEGLGVDPRVVSSPTFVIAQQYVVPEGPDVLHHIDLYRLESEDELESIGFYDMLVPGAVLAAEWADRFPGVLGSEVLSIAFEGPSPGVEPASESPESRDEALGDAGRSMLGDTGSSGGSLRTATVAAQGKVAQWVLADWAARLERMRALERSSGSRPGTGSFIEMRLGLTIILALTLWLTALIDSGADALPVCDALVPSDSDELGTLRAECLPRDAISGRGDVSGELEGIARLLAGDRIDVNSAGMSLLETLPGVGPKRAEAIVRARRERPFSSVEELERVPGIGPRTRTSLERWLRVVRKGQGGTTRHG